MRPSSIADLIAKARAWSAEDEDLMLVLLLGYQRIVLFKPDIDERTDAELATLITQPSKE